MSTKMITIAVLVDGKKTTTEIQPAVVTEHFAIHHQVFMGLDGPSACGGNWTVTHIPTGLALYTFEFKSEAFAFARAIEVLFSDWATLTDVHQLNPIVRKQIKELAKAFHGYKSGPTSDSSKLTVLTDDS